MILCLVFRCLFKYVFSLSEEVDLFTYWGIIIGGSKGAPGTPPPRSNFFSFSCSLWGKLGKVIVGAHIFTVGAPSSEKILDLPLIVGGNTFKVLPVRIFLSIEIDLFTHWAIIISLLSILPRDSQSSWYQTLVIVLSKHPCDSWQSSSSWAPMRIVCPTLQPDTNMFILDPNFKSDLTNMNMSVNYINATLSVLNISLLCKSEKKNQLPQLTVSRRNYDIVPQKRSTTIVTPCT